MVVNIDQAGDNRLADLDVDISDTVLFKTFLTHVGHNIAITTGERCGYHPYPEDDWGRWLFMIANAFNVDAGPLDIHRFQEVMDLESQVAPPYVLDWMVSYNPELLEPGVCLGACGRLPWSGAGASN